MLAVKDLHESAWSPGIEEPRRSLQRRRRRAAGPIDTERIAILPICFGRIGICMQADSRCARRSAPPLLAQGDQTEARYLVS